MKSKIVVLLGILLLILALPVTTLALIKVDMPISTVFKTAKIVLVGKVAEVTAENRVLNIKVEDSVNGAKSPGEKVRVQIANPPELIKEVAAGAPVVLFINDANVATVHVADTWLLANAVPNTNMLVWRTVQTKDDFRPSFPGRTSALVKLVTELGEGRSTFIDKWEAKPFAGGIKKSGKVEVQKASWVLADDLNGDKKPDLVIGSAAGTKVYFGNGDTFTDATAQAGALGNAGGYHATGDVNGDGKADLLLDDTIWINEGGKFAASKNKLELPKGAALAAALMDATSDQKADVLLLSTSGELRVFENPGAPDKPWALKTTKSLWTDAEPRSAAVFGDFGDTGKVHVIVASKSGVVRYALDADGGPPADLLRLTGNDLKKNDKFKDGFNNVSIVPLRVEDASRMDLLVACDAGTFLLANRGLGAFFLDETAGEALKAGGIKLSPATPAARGDFGGKGIDDLIVIGEDGTITEAANKK